MSGKDEGREATLSKRSLASSHSPSPTHLALHLRTLTRLRARTSVGYLVVYKLLYLCTIRDKKNINNPHPHSHPHNYTHNHAHTYTPTPTTTHTPLLPFSHTSTITSTLTHTLTSPSLYTPQWIRNPIAQHLMTPTSHHLSTAVTYLASLPGLRSFKRWPECWHRRSKTMTGD